jgi:hypothetical protein
MQRVIWAYDLVLLGLQLSSAELIPPNNLGSCISVRRQCGASQFTRRTGYSSVLVGSNITIFFC